MVDPTRITDVEYSNDDPKVRLAYFYQMYQNTGLIDIPSPFIEGEGEDIPADEYWLQSAAYNALVAVMDALAGLIDILDDKTRSDNDGED